ncbi:4-amino-4-deoxy-L-arabinose transferase [Klebsiella pneumoniae]|uniref:4-amino-4-deoxy-L-arabinose transferase n=1 Tax=Klebsiella pneumoniae TaxID=573 RepID=A0A2X3EB31_KLEPN|nr:4-amino-4-deoxy-L-arabinose transferase [Klebsiella pneumoniae]
MAGPAAGALKRGWLERDEARGALYLLGWVAMPFLFFSIAKGKLPTYILPCFAPLSILMARYALEAAKTGAKALRINGMINLGVGLLGLIAVLVVSPWGFMHRPVWTKIELYKCLLAAIAFAVWALMGWLAMKDSAAAGASPRSVRSAWRCWWASPSRTGLSTANSRSSSWISSANPCSPAVTF